MPRKRPLPPGSAVLSVQLPTHVHEQLKAAAEENERTMSQEVRYAIGQHLKTEAGREQPPASEQKELAPA